MFNSFEISHFVVEFDALNTLKLNKNADIFAHPSMSWGEALKVTDHLAIVAHQDDQEIMAYEGIARCYQASENWFGGVVVTDGGGSPNAGQKTAKSGAELVQVRRQEQRVAASVGNYAFQLQLEHPSVSIKNQLNVSLVEELVSILMSVRPRVLYLHQPFDKHPTHVAVFGHCLRALREIRDSYLPEQVVGCEVWRGLDWLNQEDKVIMDCSAHPDLARKLIDIFQSQISVGKGYTDAAIGRWSANATFQQSHHVDQYRGVALGLDLLPLIKNDSSIFEWSKEILGRFENDVREGIGITEYL